jgi:hypothetical protein
MTRIVFCVREQLFFIYNLDKYQNLKNYINCCTQTVRIRIVASCSDVIVKDSCSIPILRVIHKLRPIVNPFVIIKGIKSYD